MKLKIKAEQLQEAMLITNGLTGKNINLPILNNVLIKAHQDNVEFTSTNLEIATTHKIYCQPEEQGEVTVNSSILLNYVNLLDNNDVLLQSVKNDLKLNCNNYKTKIKGQGTDIFPATPTIKKDKGIVVNGQELKKALSSVVFSTSVNGTHLALSGVSITIKGDELTMVGTDSFRLSEYIVKINNESLVDSKIIIPKETIREVLKLKEEDTTIYISDNQVMFATKTTQIISRLIEDRYPNYKQIIPTDFKTVFRINRKELINAIKASAIFSKENVFDVKLEITQDQLTVSSTSGDKGDSEVKLEIFKQDPLLNNDMVINYTYFIEGLEKIEDDFLEFKMIDNTKPCLLQSISNYIYIVMPIKQ